VSREIAAVSELSCDVSFIGVRSSAPGFGGPDNLSQSSSGMSRNFEREQSQEPPVRLPPGPIPRANQPGQARPVLLSQDTSSQGSRFQSQIIPAPDNNPRFSDAYGGTTTNARISSGPRLTTPRDQSNRHGPRPEPSRPRGLPGGSPRPEASEPPPSSWSQGLGSQSSNISYHSSKKPVPPAQNGPNISGLPTTNGASGLLAPTLNRTSTTRDEGSSLRPAPLTLQTPLKSGFDLSPTTPTPSIQRSFSPVTPSDLTINKLNTSVNGTIRRGGADTVPSKPLGTIPPPLTQRAPQLPEPTKPPQPPQTSQLLPPIQPLSPYPKTSPVILPNGPPPSAFKVDESGSPLSALPSGLPTALRTAPPSALVTSLPLRPADNPHSRNARISFFDPPNQVLLDRLLATDSAIVAGSGAGGGDNEDESVRATLTNVEEMLDGFEWSTEDIFGTSGRGGLGLGAGLAGTGSAEQIEARLLDELMALEKVGFHVKHPFLLFNWCFRRRTSTRSSSRTIG
jgi:hypothetical protein